MANKIAKRVSPEETGRRIVSNRARRRINPYRAVLRFVSRDDFDRRRVNSTVDIQWMIIAIL